MVSLPCFVAWIAVVGMSLGRSGRDKPRIKRLRPTGREAPPAPKVVIAPKKSSGMVKLSWRLGGEKAEPGRAGEIRADLFARAREFLIELAHKGAVSSFPISTVTLYVRQDPTPAIHRITITRGKKGRLDWKLNGQSLTQVPVDECKNSGLPREFFGELYGIVAEDPNGDLLPRIIIDW